jgi:hypothetical protein
MESSTKTIETFGRDILLFTTTKNYKTTTRTKTLILLLKPGDPLIYADVQFKIRSVLGMLQYLVKHSRPDISNAFWELSKVADGATPGHWKTMTRLIKYVLDTEDYGLKIKPVKTQEMFTLERVSDR